MSLAESLGFASRRQLLAELDSSDLSEWEAWRRVQPPLSEILDCHLACIEWLLWTVNSKEGTKHDLDDFRLIARQKKPKSVSELYQRYMLWTKTLPEQKSKSPTALP